MTAKTTSRNKVIEPLRIANGRAAIRHVFIRDLVVMAEIGIHDHEQGTQQRVRVNLDLGVLETPVVDEQTVADVVCYEQALGRIKGIVADGHIGLVETLAERIADICLQDTRCRSARVRVEKLDAFDDVESVGVEIERYNAGPEGV